MVELTNYTIGTPNDNGTIWPNIPVIKTDGIMEIGQRLHFHGVSDSGVNFQTDLYTSAANNLILAGGGFNCSSVSASSLRAPLLKNNVIGDFVYRNSADVVLMTIKNAGAVEFAGEISTPTFNSLNVNSTISTIQNGFNYVDQQINNLIADFSGLVTEPELFAVQSSVNTL